MNNRQDELLKLVTESYIESAEPVGSKFLVAHFELEMSDATARNEMRDMEDEGYLTHPHTSAGRIPTEQGYRYYVGRLMKSTEPSKKLKNELTKLKKEETRNERDTWKAAAKLLAGEFGNAVIVAFGPRSVYYTGISLLFSQPEFRDAVRAINVSAMFDECEDRIDEVFDKLDSSQPRVLIGNDNPLSSACSLVGARLRHGNLITIVGPQRMDYAKSLGLLSWLSQTWLGKTSI